VTECNALAEFVSVELSNAADPSGRSPAGIVGSNPAGDMEVCPLCMLFVVR